jgi:hypothetical protein
MPFQQLHGWFNLACIELLAPGRQFAHRLIRHSGWWDRAQHSAKERQSSNGVAVAENLRANSEWYLTVVSLALHTRRVGGSARRSFRTGRSAFLRRSFCCLSTPHRIEPVEVRILR